VGKDLRRNLGSSERGEGKGCDSGMREVGRTFW
jgi:hypothetical protein